MIATTTRTLPILVLVYMAAALCMGVLRWNILQRYQLWNIHTSTFVNGWDTNDQEIVQPAAQQQSRDTVDDKINIFFVHVGKTGGTAIGSMLRIFCEARTPEQSRQFCFEEWKQRHIITTQSSTTTTTNVTLPETKLSQLTRGFMHVTVYYPHHTAAATTKNHPSPLMIMNEEQPISHFLVSTRNPMERVVSWFYYLHPQNCFDVDQQPTPRHKYSLVDKACITKRRLSKRDNREYQFYHDCFSTIEDFCQALIVSSGNCHELAHSTLRGYGGPNGMAGHLWANYSYYAKQTYGTTTTTTTHDATTLSTTRVPPQQIWVVRTMHLWQDLQRIEETILGGNGQAFVWQQEQSHQASLSMSSRRDHANDSSQYYHKDALSPQGYSILCCALQEELVIYQQLLQRATNLQREEKRDTFQQVLQPCFSGDASGREKTMDDLKHYCSETYPMAVAPPAL